MYRVEGGFWNTSSVVLAFNVNSSRVVLEALFSASLAKKLSAKIEEKKTKFFISLYIFFEDNCSH